ncbi:patatin-like phospholipase family protein [Egicoccus sp. AB-alg6-2]|uniref:patatin-like phospholipase family protein n=1 Tax=Egicoccus sp. AB-alg6-2 TaxID=3242692 RepID=UPI00359EFA66
MDLRDDDAAHEPRTPTPEVAFVLGGGGVHGAVQVGMLQALQEHGVRPDLVVGSSVGAMNGAMLAAGPDDAVERLRELWTNLDAYNPFEASLLERASTLTRSRTHLHGNLRLRRLLLAHLPARAFAELTFPFQCVAASIERAAAQWFTDGPLVEALLASTAVPGLLPPVVIGTDHYLDGGLVDSIPVGRALELGARRIYVLQVGRIEQPLTVPSKAWEVGLVAFEIARRHRFVEAMARVPDDVEVHVLPTGITTGMDYNDPAQFRYRDTSKAPERIETAYLASSAYLVEQSRSAAREG